MTLLPYALWYADELRAAKQTKRRHERKWKKSQLEVDRQIYAEQIVQDQHSHVGTSEM